MSEGGKHTGLRTRVVILLSRAYAFKRPPVSITVDYNISLMSSDAAIFVFRLVPDVLCNPAHSEWREICFFPRNVETALTNCVAQKYAIRDNF